MPRPISALQVVLNEKTRFPSPICTQSPHASYRSNRHLLGNLTGRKYLKTLTTGSTYTRNRDISVTFPLIIRDVLRLNFSNGADFGFWAALSGSIRGLKKVTDIRISGYPDIRISGPQTDFDENERQIPLNSPHTRAAHA